LLGNDLQLQEILKTITINWASISKKILKVILGSHDIGLFFLAICSTHKSKNYPGLPITILVSYFGLAMFSTGDRKE